MRRVILAVFFVGLALQTVAQSPAPRSLAERLGYARDAKLLIIHADDLGMAHSVNAASIRALESGAVNSASIMVPAPWFPEIAAWARRHPQADLGLHLTLTSEWTPYRWGPVASTDRVPSLLDESGLYFHLTEDVAGAKMKPAEAEAEVRAQIERARSAGIAITHLDSHMRTLHQNAALFEVLVRVARDSKLPALLWGDMTARPDFAAVLKEEDIVIGAVESIGPEVAPEQWAAYYEDVLAELKPGVTQLIVHIGYDHPDMRAATDDHPDWGSAWRQRDFDVLSSDAFRTLLRKHDVKLITWREIGKLIDVKVSPGDAAVEAR